MNSAAVPCNGTVDRVSTSGAALKLLPIISALEHDDGTQQSQMLASLLQQLPSLSSCWTEKDDSTGKEATCASLLSGLTRLVKSPTLLRDGCERLSAVVKDLLVALVKEVYPEGTSQQASPLSKRTAAYTMLKLISREGASMLPLLPADALSVFQLASKVAVQPDGDNSQADSLRPGVTTRADHALPLIVGLMGAAAQVVSAAERGAGAVQAPGAVRQSLDGVEGLDALAEGLLGAAQWGCGVLQVAIQRLTGGPPSSSGSVELQPLPEPSAPMIRAAAHLATNACLAQLTIVTGTTPNMQQVGEVLECLMDLSEAVVVSAFGVLSSADMPTQRQRATVRQVFETGASILQDAPMLMNTVVTLEHSKVVGAASSGSSPAPATTSSLSTILSRFKGILVSAAALASGPSNTSTGTPAAAVANGHTTSNGGAGAAAGARASQRSVTTASGTHANGGGVERASSPAVASGASAASAAAAGGAVVWGADVDALWDWDLQAPLTRVTMAAPPPAGADGASYGWAAQQFVRVAAEALCTAMEAVWRQGKQRALVHALLLLPGSSVSSPNERKAIALVTGRLLVLLGGDEKLSQACLPLLMDAVTMQPLASNVKAMAEATQQEAAMFACFTRTIAAMAVAGACRQHAFGHDWAYEQITDLLIRLYRDHNTPGAFNGDATDLRGACLASAITRMAEGIAAGHAPRAVQMDLQVRLLSLFSDLGMRVKAGGPGVIRAMGALMPAVAAASEGLASASASAEQRQQQHLLHGQKKVGSLGHAQSQGQLLAGTSSSRFNHDVFAKAQKEDGARMRLLRNLWLHVALHHLAAPSASPDFRHAAGRIATHTPLLLVGLDSGSPEDVAERLKVELGPRLVRVGAAADPAALRASLLGTYGLSAEPAGTMMPTEPAKRAHLLLVATCELARAALAPVSAPGDRSPLATTLAYLEVARAGSEDSQWFELLVRRAFERLLNNVAAARANTAAAAADRDVVGEIVSCMTMNQDDEVETRCAASIESLTVTLIEHLGNNGGHESGSPPKVALVSESLLQKLLTLYPHTHWDPRCMLALLSMLEAEEGDKPMGLLRPKASKGPSTVWKVLQGWVYAAALVAPTRTEAILHQFLGQTAPVAPLTAPTAATASSAHASAAALRRAADLLSTIAIARNRSGTSSGSTGTSDSVLALCRKQYYSGVVLGLQHMQLDNDETENLPANVKRTPFPVAAHKVVKALETAVQDPSTPLPVVEERYMAATALLATSSCSLRIEGSREGMEYAEALGMLLRCLVDVPRGRFCSEIMPLALFAWMWIAAANASCIIPLTNLTADAWLETARKGLGIFSGAHSPPQGNEQKLDDGNHSATDVSMVEGLQCHGLWLNFFDEMWDSVGDGGAATTTTQQSSMREIIMRMLHTSLANPNALSSHPAAAGPRFRLLNLALRLARSSAALSALGGGKGEGAAATRGANKPTGWLLASLLLRDRAIQAGLAWFTHPPAFSAHLTQRESQEQHATVQAFANGLSHLSGNGWLQEAPRMKPSEAQELLASVEGRTVQLANAASGTEEAVHPVWGRSTVTTKDAVNLLNMLCRFEADRLQVWTNPLAFAAQTQATPPSYMPLQREWEHHARTAWSISPRLAVELAGRFPTVPTLHKEVERLVVAGAADPQVQAVPEAALMLATPEAAAAKIPALQHLAVWAPGKVVEGLQLISSPAGKNPLVKTYAARCLDNTPPAEVAFYLPQLVQSLRNDSDGTIASALLHKAQASDMFAHQLIWALQTEEEPPPEAFNPEVKRSGWEPPRDFGLWGPSSDLLKKVLNVMTPAGREYWDAENSYFEKVTGISGVLKKVEKDERKGAIAVELSKFNPSRPDLYLPTNPDCRVIDHIQTSGTPMQSAAKIPILIAFQLEQLPHLVTPNPDPETQEKGIPKSLACIFKVGDDVRQDVLALQVIRLLETAFKTTGLPAYLCSYGCLPTGYERGIIEVVPNTKSRAGLGELSDKGLYDIFQAEFGMPGSPAFEAARHNFIASEAGYAIASFLLQAKDRHNGNLLISNEGHLVHIDFGFILEISPGGNMGFESAAFKLSHEMTQLLDPGANRSSATWAEFEELVVRGYLAARTVAEPIIATVALMAQSGLPCYSRGAPVDNLRRRFHLEMNEKQAAAFMRQVINDAYAKWTTGFYDYIQALQNRIPY